MSMLSRFQRVFKLNAASDILRLVNKRPISIFNGSLKQKNAPAIAYPTDTTSIKRRPKSKLKVINWFYDDFLKGTIKMNSFFTYADLTKQVNYMQFFKTFAMDDTFNSWFLITELHIWMLLVRFKNAGKDGKIASESLVAALWDDTTSRAKALSPGDSGTSKKQIQTLAQEFRASLLLYDEGLLSSDTVLSSALWYRLLAQSCDDPRLLELLTVYVRHQIQNLDNTAADDIFLRSDIKWKPLSVRPRQDVA